jgi:peptidylprolyl isomerase
VVQAGDPTGTGAGGSGVKLKAEFNARKHLPGILSMARTADPNSADSQFFIMLGTHPHLDRQYTVFGTTIEGYEHVEKIKQGDKITSWTIE